MSDYRNRRVDNVRLVRMPDGSLVMQKTELPTQPSMTNVSSHQKAPQTTPRLKQPVQFRRPPTQGVRPQEQNQQEKNDLEIGDVWEEQIRLKEEAERMELEYKLAKKMTKELRQKIRDHDEPSEPMFSDLLSPETKDFARRLKPLISRTKGAGVDALKGVKRTAKKSKIAAQITTRRVKKTKSKKALFALPAVVVVIGAGALLYSKKNEAKPTPNMGVQAATTEVKVQSIPINQNPDFGYLLPQGKTIEALGGFARVSPGNSAPAYAYFDKIGDIKIRLTQQVLPETFKKDTAAELEKTAKSFNATKLLQVNTIGAYIGKSDKGPQTVLFTKDDLLIFIVAESEVPEVGWVQYISQLNKVVL